MKDKTHALYSSHTFLLTIIKLWEYSHGYNKARKLTEQIQLQSPH